MTVKLLAIDPYDCGCTECIIGEYVPLKYATDDNIADLLSGRLDDHTYEGSLGVGVKYRTERDGGTLRLVVDEVLVVYRHHDGEVKTWEPDPYRAGLVK